VSLFTRIKKQRRVIRASMCKGLDGNQRKFLFTQILEEDNELLEGHKLGNESSK
jgi:hypothetical protein